jgi:endoglucanase
VGQKWTVTNRGSDQYSIIGVQSGKAIEVSNWGTANGTKVQLWDWVNGTNQKHTFTATSGGYYRITPVHATGSCLDVAGISTADGALVHLWTYGGANNQQWALQAP